MIADVSSAIFVYSFQSTIIIRNTNVTNSYSNFSMPAINLNVRRLEIENCIFQNNTYANERYEVK